MALPANFLQVALKDHPDFRVLALDPGETTGACVFEGPKLLDARQLPTGLMPLGAVVVRNYLNGLFYDPSNSVGPIQTPFYGKHIDMVVIEDYRVYSWKTKDHAWQGLHTPRLIGALELICLDQQMKMVKQTAQQGKGFCTDDKLQAWGLWQEGQRHARDAIRHALYYLLFGVAKLQVPGQKAPGAT